VSRRPASADVFLAIADPTRRRMLEMRRADEKPATELARSFRISQPSVSQHLRVLREAGLVSVVPEGKTRVYHLDPRPLRELDGWLQRYRKFWATKLDALESFMDEEPK
jgi:DNA-binding transcriptional ArsR family regulator